MSKPRQVPGISHLRQQFAPSNLPPIQSPMQPPFQMLQTEDTSAEDLAQEIYVRLVASGVSLTADPDVLRAWAQTAREAARIYFEEPQQ